MRQQKPCATIISFRLSSALAESLTAEAKKYGISSHEMARELVIGRLLDESDDALGQALSDLQVEMQKLRSDLKQSVIAVLCDAGKLDLADAEAWVNSRLFE